MMSRQLVVSIAIVIADGAWIYMALAMASIVLAQSDAPLAWQTILILLSAGTLMRALGDRPEARLITFVAGAVTCYTAVWFHPRLGDDGPVWLLELLKGHYSFLDVLGIVLAILGAAWSWRRGMTLCTETSLENRAARLFRTGLVIMSLAFVLQLTTSRDLGSDTLMLPFFLASLFAIALARLPDATVEPRKWLFLIATVVVLALGLGILIGVVFAALGRGGINLIIIGWNHIAEFVVNFIEVVIVSISWVILSIAAWFNVGENRNEQAITLFELPIHVTDFPKGGIVNETTPFEHWPYLLATVVIYVLIRVLKPSVISRARPLTAPEMHREELDLDSQPIDDLTRLMKIALGLSSTASRPPWQFPRASPGITEVFELYFEMLDAAIARGAIPSRSATPLEQREHIAASLPGVPVDQITKCFNAACYGSTSTSLEVVLKLKHAMRDALTTSKTVKS